MTRYDWSGFGLGKSLNLKESVIDLGLRKSSISLDPVFGQSAIDLDLGFKESAPGLDLGLLLVWIFFYGVCSWSGYVFRQSAIGLDLVLMNSAIGLDLKKSTIDLGLVGIYFNGLCYWSISTVYLLGSFFMEPAIGLNPYFRDLSLDLDLGFV